MTDIKTFEEYPNISWPRRLRRYVFIWCSKGTVTLAVDENEFTLKQHHVLTITSGQVHYFKTWDKAEGFILEFTLDFFWLASEARRLLTYRKLSVKEVAYQLGFNDPFYFSNFFKKHTNISPKSYQSMHAYNV